MKSIYKTTAVWDGRSYIHFGIHKSLASLYGDDPEDIENLNIKISKDQSIPDPNTNSIDADYWGWYDNGDKEFTMIYSKHFLLNMCFPNGIKASEKAGQGKAYRLEII